MNLVHIVKKPPEYKMKLASMLFYHEQVMILLAGNAKGERCNHIYEPWISSKSFELLHL